MTRVMGGRAGYMGLVLESPRCSLWIWGGGFYTGDIHPTLRLLPSHQKKRGEWRNEIQNSKG